MRNEATIAANIHEYIYGSNFVNFSPYATTRFRLSLTQTHKMQQGCLGMKIGEERLLEIPAHEGYGENGFPQWGIPPGGTLFFTLECLAIKK